jgi:ribosomal protein L16 Arg81 hydroxylase
MWNGGQLPWGKPYFQDVRQTMLQTDPGYQQARQWWSQQQAQASADAERVRQLEAELDEHRAQYSKLEADHGRTVADIDRLERIWSLPRG